MTPHTTHSVLTLSISLLLLLQLPQLPCQIFYPGLRTREIAVLNPQRQIRLVHHLEEPMPVTSQMLRQQRMQRPQQLQLQDQMLARIAPLLKLQKSDVF